MRCRRSVRPGRIQRRRVPAPGRRRGRHQQPRCVDLPHEFQVFVRESQELGERAVRGHRPTVQCHPGVGRSFDPVLPPARHVRSVIILSRRSAWAGRNSSLCFFRDYKSGHTRPGRCRTASTGPLGNDDEVRHLHFLRGPLLVLGRLGTAGLKPNLSAQSPIHSSCLPVEHDFHLVPEARRHVAVML